jgi:hypothetical protein
MPTLGVLLNQLFDRLQQLVQQFQNAGLVLEVNAGAQIQALIQQTQAALTNVLNTAASDLSAQQQQLMSGLTGLVDDLQKDVIDDLTSRVQTIANTLPFANHFPQLAGFSGNIVAPNIPGDIQFSISGNFVDIGEAGYDAILQLGGAKVNNGNKTTGLITFTIPRTAFTFVTTNVAYLSASISVPYKVSEVLGLIHKKEFASFNVIFIVLPISPGTYDLQTTKSVQVAQQVSAVCGNLVWDSSDDDQDMVQGCNMSDDWQCIRESVRYSFSRCEGDQGSDWFDLGNASTTTFVGWHFKTEHHGLGTSGKLTVNLNYQKTHNVPQTQTTDTGNLALAWGDAKVLTVDPTASWKIVYHQFNGETKEYASSDKSNPYIRIVSAGNQISLSVIPFSENP